MSKRKRRIRVGLCGGVALCALLLVPALGARLRAEISRNAVSTVTGQGIEGARSFPPWGKGYRTYSPVAAALGRQYAHAEVVASMLEAFQILADENPERVYIVAETGWRRGGRFFPHRTHRHGLSVDVHMPLVSEAQQPVVMSSWPWNGWGYCLKFDAQGHQTGWAWEGTRPQVWGRALSPCIPRSNATGDRIDFPAVARLLAAVDTAAVARGGRLKQVIVAPEFVKSIASVPEGRQVKGRLTRKAVWVRHDDHVHLEFGF